MSAIRLRPWMSNKKFIGAAVATTVFLAIYTIHSGAPALKLSEYKNKYFPPASGSPDAGDSLEGVVHEPEVCTPHDYAAGHWKYAPRTNATIMTDPDEAHAFAGFEGCASSREYTWHLASDTEAQWGRFPGAQSWEWVPGEKCKGMRPLEPLELLRTLVEDGGWYLVGDSVTENHFFSLSCILYPHVRATPNYKANEGFDRAWPQNLYLESSSPLISSLNLPTGFDIEVTPLATFRRIDILMSREELIDVHRSIQEDPSKLENNTLFSDELVWTLSPSEYTAEFLAPLPKANYATMVVSTAGHWTVTTFNQTVPEGIEGVLNLFDHAMVRWAGIVQAMLWEANTKTGSAKFRIGKSKKANKRAVIRAYLPGHEDCHNFRKPWEEIQPFINGWYNWPQIANFNEIWEKLLSNRDSYPDIHYLGIDRPARLRPDAHATGDCLHIMSGAGVLEGWSHYIWQYISKEIPRHTE